MKYITRFNPTVNGHLHVGHLYVALVNKWEAEQSGGRFLIRFDDAQIYWRSIANKNISHLRDLMETDLQMMGISGHLSAESTLLPATQKLLDSVFEGPRYLPMMDMIFTSDVPEVVGVESAMYPYAPYLTAHKVLMDFQQGVNLLIRGSDLLTEFSLYSYFCDVFKVPCPRHVYLPRLMTSTGDELADISKTAGTFSIASMLTCGWTPQRILQALANCCLEDPTPRQHGFKWSIDNIRKNPVWSA